MILSRTLRIFGFLISSGVPIIEALRIAAHVAENPIYRDKLLLTASDVTKGIPIAENLSDDEKMFPSMLVNMIAVGEKTASLEDVMQKVANFYDDELDRKIGNLATIMEPFILFFIAGIVIFMILAIFLPILGMNDKLLETFLPMTSFV
jgi:type IV pilus assembly protein PilC